MNDTASLILSVRRSVKHCPVTILNPSTQILAFDDFRVSDVSIGFAASCQRLRGHISWSTKRIFDLENRFAGCDEVLVDAALAIVDAWYKMLVSRSERSGRDEERHTRFYDGELDQAGSIVGDRAGVLETGSHVVGCSGQREEGKIVESRAWGKREASDGLL